MEPILYAAAAVLAITALVHWIARSINVPSPILLVVAGVVLALVPGLPRIALPPNLVLLVFLPPLIYYAAFGMSWQAFRDNLREIITPCCRLRRIYHDCRRGRGALAHWAAMGRRVRAWRHCFATRRRGAACDCAASRCSEPPHRNPRRRRSGQRCDRACAVQVRADCRVDGRLLSSSKRR